MKRIIYTIVVVLLFSVYSCNKDKILSEAPLDFYSPENSFTKPADVESSIAYLYARVRALWDGDVNQSDVYYGTDLASGIVGQSYDDYKAQLVPTSQRPQLRWTNLYRIVFDANVILNRIGNIEYPDTASKDAHKAEAMFFRAYAFNCLANFFGGVPIVLDEITSPRRDFVRDTREAVYQQCASDLEFAAANLPDINHVVADGRVSKAAADHLLSEVYIELKQWDKAIAAASAVINNPNFHLMTNRFGSSASDTSGDPYYDLFQPNNQNRSSGNTEAIWVLQSEFNTPGGFAPLSYSQGGFKYERFMGPLYWQLKDPDGVAGFIGPTTQNGGRGIGWVRGTYHYTNTIWESDWNNDIRNAPQNMQRDWIFDNPKSQYFGTKVSDALNAGIPGYPGVNDTLRFVYAYPTKVTTRGKHPVEIIKNAQTGELQGSAGVTYLDWYLMRLAETYLLRAEAYLGKGQKDQAAMDINVVRQRAHAKPVTADEVDINYILDERMRELNFEEPRRLTLSRLGMLYERTVKYGRFSNQSIQQFNELYPIPFGEIEKNTDAVLKQNPGYVN